jgi:heat shock protein HtpX
MWNLTKRVFLFMAVNLLVLLAIGVLFAVLQVFFPALRGQSTGGMLVLAALFGSVGSLISLFLSKWLAKRGQGVVVIDPATATGEERWLIQTVYKLAKQAGIEDMPEVGIWDSPEVNAFCTGPSKNSSLVAVSTGILRTMDHAELEGVLGHELSHAANGDMVTMALIQGVVNTFVIFFSWMIAQALTRRSDDDSRGGGGFFMYHILVNVLQMVLGMLATVLVVAPFTRYREFRADAGGAHLAGKDKMIAGLQALLDQHRVPLPAGAADPALAAFKIDGYGSWFATHPPLEARIARLKEMTILH